MDVVVATTGLDKIMIFLLYDNGTVARIKLYLTGTQSLPYSIVVDDFNHDNCLDIAVANYNAHNIEIFLGYGNGTFANSKVLSTGSSRPLFINVGDLNNDNQSDIIIANYDTDSISILLGNGDGSFKNEKKYFTGYDSSPRSLAVGDFNKDNQLDIAIANYGTNNIGILLGYGNGGFASQQIYTTNLNSNPISIAIGDFNNDNNLDIVVANYGTGTVGVFLNYDNGTFAPQNTYSIGINPLLQYVTVGDLNNDNELDIVIVDSNNDQVHIFPGYGNGTFATISTYDVVSGSRPFAVAIADINNDNQSDIVVINYETNKLLILEMCSMEPSARQRNYLLQAAAHSSTVAIADFNNNTHLDIVVNGYEGSSVRILFDYNNGTFAREISYSSGNNSNPQHICTVDLNNDNRIDIVTANLGSDSVGVLLGYGDGNFTPATTYSAGIGSSPRFVVVKDIDNDSHLDIISANRGSSIGVFFGYGNGSFASVMTYSTGMGSFPASVAVGDVNNDNQLDIVVSIINPDGIVVFQAHNKTTFSMIMFYSTGYDSAPVSIALADFDNDNQLDIVVANSRANNVCILFGLRNGTFGRQRTYETGSESLPYFVVVTDFNHDNQLDIAITYLRNDKVVIFSGHGNGDFELVRTYSVGTGSHPYGLAVADFNNDKKLEIVVTLWGNGYVAILTEYYAAKFAEQIMYPMGLAPQPYSVAVGDFNRDNQSDIVVANSGTDTIDVRINLGNNTFATYIMSSTYTGLYPRYVNVADIDNDDNLDIVTVYSQSDSVSVNLGYGNGSFKAATIYSTGAAGSHPCSIVFGDLNNDSRLDLIIANEGTDNIAVLLGYNYTTFHKQKTYKAVGSFGPRQVVVGDFNNDSYPDVAVVFYTTYQLGIFLGDGNGSFNVVLIYSTTIGSTPYALTVGDINKDGRLDVIVANMGTNNVGVFLGYGNGSFASVMTFSTGIGSMPYSVAVADFDDDGRLDIVVINIGTKTIGILYGYGNGSFAVMVTYLTGENYVPTAVTVGDFNNDSQVDIAVVNTDANNVGIFLGYGNGSFTKQVTYSTRYGTRPYWVALGDFNNDNKIDMVTANHYDNSISIFLGHGNGSFSDVKTYGTGDGAMPMYVTVGDFNNDNKLDVAVVSYGTNGIVVNFGLGDGTFLGGDLYSTGTGSEPNTLETGDFNKDGRLDIIVSNPGSDTIGLFLGNDSKPFANVKLGRTGVGSQPQSVALGDFNNDGISDIVVANYGNNNVGIFLGLGRALFDTMLTYSTGVDSSPYFVAVEDLNNDNRSDIVVANFKTDNIAILLGYGNGTFTTAVIHTTGYRSRPSAVAIADFDKDNILDIAVANSGTSTVLLLYGNGNGTFRNEELYPLGYGYLPYSIAVTDLNHNGFMDIVIACYGTDNIEILLKIC